MIVSQAFRGKTYAVLGLARSGLATVDTLVASGARVVPKVFKPVTGGGVGHGVSS